jgi:2-polyprenyl-3-methyl-5-hydroxy-6-metoxy-1,4-benzoquinol methylase
MRELIPVELEDIACPMNCVKGDKLVLTGFDRLHDLPGEFNVVKCCVCGLMRTNPRPTPATIGLCYPDVYGPYLGTKLQKSTTTSRVKKLLTPLVRKLFDDQSQRLPPKLSPSRMLEIGCASGAFLHHMASQGWQVEGIEFSATASQAARQLGYKVYTGALENAPAPTIPVDLIVGWMVLEHLHNPIVCLKKLHDWSSSNASLVISVPNANAFEFNLFKDEWYSLHLPNHLFHYTPQTLAKVFTAGGWTIQKVHHHRSITNLVSSLAYVIDRKGWPKLGKWLMEFSLRSGKWYYIRFPIAWIFAIFGQTGRMTVWASKI